MLTRLAGWCYDRRRLVVAGWVLAVILFSIAGQAAGGSLLKSFNLPGTESSKAFAILGRDFSRKGDTGRSQQIRRERRRIGHAALARHLYQRGLFADPAWLQLCLGVPWGAPATTEAMLAMKQLLPPGANWSAFGIAVATGLGLAAYDHAFDTAPTSFDAVLAAKGALAGLLAAGVYLHDYVLGPGLARQIREGRPQTLRPLLTGIGRGNLLITLALPVLGVVLSELVS